MNETMQIPAIGPMRPYSLADDVVLLRWAFIIIIVVPALVAAIILIKMGA